MSEFHDQDNQFSEFEESPGSQPPQGGPVNRNRVFFIAIGLIGAIFVIAVLVLLFTFLNRGTGQASQVRDQAAAINTQNAQVAATATADQLYAIQQKQTADAAAKITPSATATALAAAATSVLAVPTATGTPTPTVSAEMTTQTAVAKITAAAIANGVPGLGTPGPGTPGAGTPAGTAGAGTPGAGLGTPSPKATATSALPATGFADEVGLPGLFGLAALLIVVIFGARRIRQAH